ncbi:MAG: hypothetical protein JWO94_3433 [Verrucomicrobiaceae bacterium]|nr:hypothetical protein [Verrucomicrobiaceae bacterium]
MSNRSLQLSFPLPGPGQSSGLGLTDWDSFTAMDKALAGTGFRVRYLRGIFEIMSISRPHEYLKSLMGSLIETYCQHVGIDYFAWGSATHRIEGVASAEPDESYTFGVDAKETPDLVIEVGLTSGGIDKCALWSDLGAKEIWIWENDRLHAFQLEPGRVEPIRQSLCLPALDLVMIDELVRLQPTSAAVRELRRRLAA